MLANSERFVCSDEDECKYLTGRGWVACEDGVLHLIDTSQRCWVVLADSFDSGGGLC